jgi:chitodextrinase
MKKVLHSIVSKILLLILVFCGLALSFPGYSQSASLPTDRARITVASIPDYFGGPNLKVLRTDAGTPLRAGTAWIWEGGRQEEPNSYYASMRQKGLNAVRMILFDTWQIEAGYTVTDWNNAAYRIRQLDRMERAVNYASANGMYIIINSHNKIPLYNESYANALWTYVAPYFANRTHVIYEAANEPMPGIGVNGDMDMGSAGATSSPRLQALKHTFNIMRAAAPNTHIMVLTPNGISDYGYGTGLGNLAASFAQLPGDVDWTKTSVAYHLYHNDGAAPVSINAGNLRNFHSRYPGWPSENNFPASVSNETLGITDSFRSPQFDNDIYVNQTCERLGLGWSMWNINGQAELDRNWPVMYDDAVAKGWNWIPDPTTPDTQAPTVPTALVATNVTASSLTLSWAASADNIAVTNYELFRDGVNIGTTATATTTFSVTGLVCATTANFTVKARDAAGNTSAASNALSITTGNCPTSFVVEAETNYTTVADMGSNCAVGPSNYGATTASNGMVVVLCDIGDEIRIAVNVFVSGNYDIQVRVRSGWNGSPMHFINNNKYEYRLNDVLRTFTYVSGSVTSAIDVDSYYATVRLASIPLTEGVNYIRVKALENWAKVDFVQLDQITDTQAPTVPNSLSASGITGSGFMLAWAASSDNVGVTGYEVFRDGISLGTTATTTFSVTGLVCATTANFTVKARDAAGNWSASSSILTVSTTLLPNAGTISGTTTLCAGTTSALSSNGLAGGTWSSSNSAIATINTSGVLSGVSAGTTTITYSVSDNGCTSSTTTTVTINPLPNAGTISGTSTLTTGTTTTLTSNGLSGGSWTSSNIAVATVNASGVVSGVSAGTTAITYTVTSNGCTSSVSATITVTAPVSTTTIVVRARSVGKSGASFRVEIMNGSSATGGTILQNSSTFSNLSTGFANYSFTATGNINPNQIRVRYLNDLSRYDFETDYIVVNGTTYQTEASTTYSEGFWNSTFGCNNAGFLGNTLIQCNGYFHFLATSGARLGAESLEIESTPAFGIFPNLETETVPTFSVYPNPAKDVLTVLLHATAEQQVQMQIIGASGIVLKLFSEPVKAGKNTIKIPVHTLHEGTFILSAEYDNGRSEARFIVIR